MRGVRALKFKVEDDVVVGMVIAREDATLLTMCEGGYGKRTGFEEYRLQSRGGSGVRNIKTTARNGKVVTLNAVTEEDDIVLVSERGMVVRTEAKQVSLVGRDTQGVRVMALKDGDRLVACAHLAAEEEEDGGHADSEEPAATEE